MCPFHNLLSSFIVESTFYKGKNLFSRENLFYMALYGLIQIDDAHVKLDSYVTFIYNLFGLILLIFTVVIANFLTVGLKPSFQGFKPRNGHNLQFHH